MREFVEHAPWLIALVAVIAYAIRPLIRAIFPPPPPPVVSDDSEAAPQEDHKR